MTIEKDALFELITKILAPKVDVEWKWLNEIVTGIYSSLNEVTEFMLRGYVVVKEQGKMGRAFSDDIFFRS